MFPKYLPRHKAPGFTLVDLMMAVGIIALGLSGLCYSNSQALTILRTSRETMVASKMLQERLEKIRAANWTEITDAAYLQDFYSVATSASPQLTGETESITVSQYPPPVPASSSNPIKVSRAASGTVTLAAYTANAGGVLAVDLNDQPMVRVDVSVTWPGAAGRTHTRETSTIISNGGIGR